MLDHVGVMSSRMKERRGTRARRERKTKPSRRRTDEGRTEKTEGTRRDEDEVVEDVKHSAAHGGTDLIGARPVEAERQTVEQDHAHAHPLEPRASPRQGFAVVTTIFIQQLEATLRGSRPGVQSASLIMTSLMTS